ARIVRRGAPGTATSHSATGRCATRDTVTRLLVLQAARIILRRSGDDGGKLGGIGPRRCHRGRAGGWRPYGEMTWPVAVPSTLPTYACATVAAGKPPWSGMPSACSVSVTQGGLTALIRIPRGASSAAARAKPSRPAFTRLITPLPREGCWARMPVVMVIEPPSVREPSPYLDRLT